MQAAFSSVLLTTAACPETCLSLEAGRPLSGELGEGEPSGLKKLPCTPAKYSSSNAQSTIPIHVAIFVTTLDELEIDLL